MRRFEVALSDSDRGVYEGLDLRVAQHPSACEPDLVARVLARALEHGEGARVLARARGRCGAGAVAARPARRSAGVDRHLRVTRRGGPTSTSSASSPSPRVLRDPRPASRPLLASTTGH
ncbi:MAG: YaeQ family protein [Deltaproteobacteria bacterium]|nr:YaeQ family protein [Deltaproteobacteria bacterium]